MRNRALFFVINGFCITAYANDFSVCQNSIEAGEAIEILGGLNFPSLPNLPSPPNLPSLPSAPALPNFPPLPGVRLDPLDKTVRELGNEVQRIGDIAIYASTRSTGDILRTLSKGGQDIATTFTKAGEDAVTTVVKAGNDSAVAYYKAWKDVSDQTKRSFSDSVNAASASANFLANQTGSMVSLAQSTERKIREGKLVDAMWEVGVKPLQATEANFAEATQQSSIIAAAASTAAATYGGPGGAAAYAAWATYRSTGNADMALRAGLLAAASAQAGPTLASLPSRSAEEALRKAALAGALGGLSVAAAGGDEKAITEGFLKSSGAVLIQAGRTELEAYSPKAKNAWELMNCISARDIDCTSRNSIVRDSAGKFVYDKEGRPKTYLNKLQELSGRWSEVVPQSEDGLVAQYMAEASKLPKLNAIPLIDNRWTLTWTLGKNKEIERKQPAVVLTYTGPSSPFLSKVGYRGNDGKFYCIENQRNTNKNIINLYSCHAGGISRTIKATLKTKGCSTIYARSDGKIQVLWNSNYYQDICFKKAEFYVTDFKKKGIQCNAEN